jgi:hypothetical protein
MAHEFDKRSKRRARVGDLPCPHAKDLIPRLTIVGTDDSWIYDLYVPLKAGLVVVRGNGEDLEDFSPLKQGQKRSVPAPIPIS